MVHSFFEAEKLEVAGGARLPHSVRLGEWLDEALRDSAGLVTTLLAPYPGPSTATRSPGGLFCASAASSAQAV